MSASDTVRIPAIPRKVAALIPSLGRDNDHEVVATVRAISAVLNGHGHDWHDLAHAIEAFGRQPNVFSPSATTTSARTSSRRSPPASSTHSFGDMARACRDLDRGRLKLREKQFVVDMVRRGFSYCPSPRQSAWLTDIFDRLKARAAA